MGPTHFKRLYGEQLSERPLEANLFSKSLPAPNRLSTRGNKITRTNGIGLGLSTMADSGAVEEMIVMTGDTDLIPALRLVRSRGSQVSGVSLPNYAIIGELRQHLDLFRSVVA
ncbi:MAG TPA: hypothetical protein VF534_30980 [Paraburkholderia sp.]